MASSNPSGSSIPGPRPSQVSMPENETEPEGHKTLKSHLMSAIQTDNIEEVERLLDQNSFLTNATTCYEVEYNQGSIECQVLPVTIAAKFGRVAILDMLLSHFTANVDAPIYSTGLSSLHLAAQYGWLVAIKLLLFHGAEVNRRANAWGWTALHYASRYGHTDIVKHLSENGASSQLRTDRKQTAFSLACYSGSLELLNFLWNDGPETQIRMKDNRGNQPLHHTAFGNNHQAISWLLEKQADIEAKGEAGLTPLCAAAIAGSFEAVEALLSQGAYIHARSNIGKAAPILYASQRLDSRLSILLLEGGASLSDTDKRGYNCIHHMLENKGGSLQDFADLVALSVGGGANINHLSDGDLSPLASACLEGKLGEARILIEYGADVNQCGSSSGVTPLIMACKRPKNNKVIAMLLDRGADATKTHRHGGTALSIACLAGDSENVETLIARGIDVAHFDRHCHTPLFNAAMKGHFDIMLQVLRTATYFPSNPTNKRAFTDPRQSREVIGKAVLKALEHLPDLPQEDLHTIMYWAVANDYPSLVKKCIEIDNSIVQKTREKANWLHTAAQHSSSQVIHFVSEAGVSEKATNGNTAMHYAAFSGSLETAEELFKLVVTGCPVNTAHAKVRLVMQRNVWDYTPISMAVSGRHKAVMDLFWEEIRCLGTVDKDYLRTHEEQAVEILELVARLEKPGHEETLRHLLEQWCMREPDPQMTTLELAVRCSQATTVWWLLSNGAYSWMDMSALGGIFKPEPGTVHKNINDLLRDNPPNLRSVANPNDDRPPKLPQCREILGETLNLHGLIIDTCSCGAYIEKKETIKKIIYDEGPTGLMGKERHHPLQRFHDFKESLPKIGEKLHEEEPPLSDSSHAALDLLFRWIHLPVAEMHLMRDLANRLSHDSGVSEMDHELMMQHFNSSWTELSAGGGGSYMKPRCAIKYTNKPLNNSAAGQRPKQNMPYLALYADSSWAKMPYLGFGTYEGSSSSHKFSSDMQRKGIYESIQSRRLRRINHRRMTLDQYYYSVLTDTDRRDRDQVLSKFIDAGNKQTLETLITATTEKEPDNFLVETIRKNLTGGETRSRFAQPQSIHMFIEQILGITTGFFEWPIVGLKTPLDVFRESIRKVANDEAELFKVFHEALEAERGQQHDSAHRAGHAVKVMPSNPYHIISPETTLLEKIRDIRDELRILSTLADDQDAVWKQMLPSYTANGKLRYYYLYTPADAKHDLAGSIAEAETAHDSINLLLDLRQKQASIKEAEFGRIQANDSARQSNSILIFTIVTIIFRAQLPLSFLSSLFALDVSSFPHESGDLKYQGWWLFPILFGVTAIVSVPTIILAWKINKVSDWWNKLEPGVQNGPRIEREADDIGSHSSRRSRFGGAVRKRNTGGEGIA
ncbi:hypothetical protein FPRO04_03987 [Fusarium proliferatum]|nr:hypothetical protein FPRO03_06180 [Fusarium proliferatum]KAG4268898.1 hypothetical protein FPRO04_03987 [Fusarium proliferatum]